MKNSLHQIDGEDCFFLSFKNVYSFSSGQQ